MKLRFVALLALLVLATGCSVNKPMLKKEAFAEPQTLAVVVAYGMMRDFPMSDAERAQLMDSVPAMTIELLSRSPHVKMLEPDKVLASPGYQTISDAGPLALHQIATNYKLFQPPKEPEALAAMAQELGVDGFLVLRAYYGTKDAGGWTSSQRRGGLTVSAFSGRVHATLTFQIEAYDAEGKPFWKEFVAVTDEQSTVFVMGGGRYSELKRNLDVITRRAILDAGQRLDSQLAAR